MRHPATGGGPHNAMLSRKPCHTAPHRPSRTLAPALLAALTTVALFGCAAAAPIKAPEFPATAERQNYDQTYFPDRPIKPLVLPAATGGSGTLTYSLGPRVPPGLEFDSLERTLTGTPSTRGTYPMRYVARDANGRTDKISFSIIVEQYSAIGSIVAEFAVGDRAGVLRFADVPEPGAGPAVAVTGNHRYVAGGAVFLDIEPEPGAAVDKLLLSIRGQSAGYYEIDLPAGASSHRLDGQVRFDLAPDIPPACLDVSAVDASGTVGPPTCHVVIGIAANFSDVQVTVSWDTDADLDLHVADPTGHEVYFGTRVIESGGFLDVVSGGDCDDPDGRRNEHIAWSIEAPPPGLYEVRLSHYMSCGADDTNYVVNVYNHGTVSTFSGTFTGPGDDAARGTGRVIAQFELPGDAPAVPAKAVSSTYRGSGDQVFVLNPNGEALDDTFYTLNLGSASAEVYVISTTGNYHLDPQVEWLDLREAAAKGRQTTAQAVQQSDPRPAVDEVSPRLQWLTAFNNFNDGPPVWEGSADPARIQALQAQSAVREGQRFTYFDPFDKVDVPVTVRRVVTDGTLAVAVWVADQEWAATCASRGECVTQEMVDAVADRFLSPGANNDIYDWVTNIFGAPWGPHEVLGRDGQPLLLPAEAADEIHILMYDIDGDGVAPSTAGYYWRGNNFLRQPDHPVYQFSLERLILFMDSPLLALSESDFLATLAHEFQHVIHYYQKPVLRGAISEGWLNEQASEVAEDLIADKLMVPGPRGVAHDDPTAGEPENRRGRLNVYNLYNDSQVTAWDGSGINYSLNYAFGAYLARNYGGAALYSDIVQSDRSGVGAIDGAVSGQGHDESFLDLLVNWAAANLLSDNTAAPVPYQYNTGDWRSSNTGGVEYRLGSINLYNYIIGRPGRLARPGPYLYPLPVFNDRTQPPHSNMYTTLGRNSGSLRLSVTADTQNIITVVVKE